MDWPNWTHKADRALRGVGRGAKAAAQEIGRQYAAAHAWEGVPLGECRICGQGKLYAEALRPLGGRVVWLGYLARFAAVCCALSAVPVALVGAAGHLSLMLLIMAFAWGLSAPLYVLGFWCTYARPGVACAHCRAWHPAA